MPLPPHIRRLALRLFEVSRACPHSIDADTLRAINREHPELSFRDFVIAVGLVEMFETRRRQSV
jgi:hypothetical protein